MRHADGYAYRVSDSYGYGYGYSYAYRDTFGDPDVRAGSTDNNTLRLE